MDGIKQEQSDEEIEIDPLSTLVIKVEVQEFRDIVVPEEVSNDDQKPPERNRCSKCQIVYTNHASFRNHVAVCQRNEFRKPLTKDQVEMSDEIRAERKRSIEILERSCFRDLEHPNDQEEEEGEALGECHYCQECNLMFKNLKQFACHSYAHTFVRQEVSEMPYICADCGTDFENLTEAEQHLEWKNNTCQNLPKRLFPCDICDCLFTRKDNLRHHLKDHAGYRNQLVSTYDCKMCGRTFGGQTVLNFHFRSHKRKTNCYNYACKICRNVYSCSSSLRKHERMHKKGITLLNDGSTKSNETESKIHNLKSSEDSTNSNLGEKMKLDDESSQIVKMEQRVPMKTYKRTRV